jgi:gamma-glutamylcyclotransferase
VRLKNYFAYGSNVLHTRLAARVPIHADLGSAALAGWQLRFDKRGRDGSGKCTIVPGKDSDWVYGALYQLTDAACEQLDVIEGVGRGYSVRTITLPEFGQAYCHVADTAHRDHTLRPFGWYWEVIVAGARQRGFPQPYLAALLAVETWDDPDGARTRVHRALWTPAT